MLKITLKNSFFALLLGFLFLISSLSFAAGTAGFDFEEAVEEEAPASQPQPEPQPQTTTSEPQAMVKVDIAKGCLNVRSNSNTSSKSIGCIADGTTLKPTGKVKNGFVEVTYQGKPAWLKQSMTETVQDSAAVTDPSPTSQPEFITEQPTEQQTDQPAEQPVIPTEVTGPTPDPKISSSTDAGVYGQTPEQACAFLTDPRMNLNCMSLFRKLPGSGKAIDSDALLYSLAYFRANVNGFKDLSCAKKSSQRAGLPKKFSNTCSFVINDVERNIVGFALRTQAFYIDLCAKSVHDSVRPFNAKKGTGTEYWDKDNKKSTVAGVFATDNEIRAFGPGKNKHKYAATAREFHNGIWCPKGKKKAGCPKGRNNGMIPALDLTPLHSTNNHSLDDKPVHVSPFNSSNGCPAVDKTDYDILHKLARKGPSMWVNYGEKRLHPESSITDCDGVPEGKELSFGKTVTHKQRNGKKTVKTSKKRPAAKKPKAGDTSR